MHYETEEDLHEAYFFNGEKDADGAAYAILYHCERDLERAKQYEPEKYEKYIDITQLLGDKEISVEQYIELENVKEKLSKSYKILQHNGRLHFWRRGKPKHAPESLFLQK